MTKITESELKDLAADSSAIELRVVDEGMSVELTADGKSLHTTRGTRRVMSAQTGLKYAYELGLSEVRVKLPKGGREE